jgi:hypothetical protein
MGEVATRTRTVWKHDEHGTYALVITEPESWWRRQWERLVEGIDVLGDVAMPVLSVLGWALLIALAVYSLATGPHDSDGDSPDTPSATFSTWPSATPPTTPVTAPLPQRY